MPASRVHDLAEVCEPAVTVIAIGKCNDVGLYRDLIKAGNQRLHCQASNPGTAGAGSVPRQLTGGETTSISHKRGKMVAVVGARGGVGTTTLAVNLAWYLADRRSRRIALVDLDLQNGLRARPQPQADPRLAGGANEPVSDQSLPLERAMVTHSERLFVLSSAEPLRDKIDISDEAIDVLLRELRAQFHYVIADVPRITATPYRLALDIADHRIIVSDHTLRSVRDTARLRTALGGSDAAHRNVLVINRSGEGGRREVTLEEMGNYIYDTSKNRDPVSAEAVLRGGWSGKGSRGSARQVCRSGRSASGRDLGTNAGTARMVEVGEVTTSGFGRRIVELPGPELTLAADFPESSPTPTADLVELGDLKERIRTVLMTRIDPSVAGRMPREHCGPK